MSSGNAFQKQKREAQTGLANAPLKKKIGFFSAMMIVIGAVMGAGIFFKSNTVLSYSQGSIIMSIFCWLIGVFAVISMVLALIEISSARNDNLSIIGWCQTFNKRIIHKASKNFFIYVFVPLSYFFLPLYVIMSIQDGVMALVDNYNGFGTNADWSIMMVFTLLISLYFIIVCGLSSRIGNIQNWIITCLNMIPAIIAIIAGFVCIGLNNGELSNPDTNIGFVPTPTDDPANLYRFGYMTPGIGIFIAVGAIFFAYDGFYLAAGMQSELKEPKKISLALILGLFVVTIIYLSISIAMSLGSTNGTPSGFLDFFKSHHIIWLYILFNILIGVGVLSIINSFGMWTPRLVENLVAMNEIPYGAKFIKKLNNNRPKVGIMYNIIVVIPVIIIFCAIGGLGYINTYSSSNYGTGVGSLYSFADLMATWASVGAFTFIIFSIFGALKNRKTHAVIVKKTKYLKPMAILCLFLSVLPIFFTFFTPIADLFLLYRIPTNIYGVEYINVLSDVTVSFKYAYHGINGELITSASNASAMFANITNSPGFIDAYNNAFKDVGLTPPAIDPNLIKQTSTVYYDYTNDVLVPRIMTVVTLLLYMLFTFGPTLIEDIIYVKKYGSVQNGQKQKFLEFARASGSSPKDELLNQLRYMKVIVLNEWQKEILKQDKLTLEQIKYINNHVDFEKDVQLEMLEDVYEK